MASLLAITHSDQVHDLLTKAGADLRIQRIRTKLIHQAQPDMATIADQMRQSRWRLIVIEMCPDEDATAFLSRLAVIAGACDTRTAIMAIGHDNDVPLYRQLSSEGLSDYLVMPISQATLLEAIRPFFSSDDGHSGDLIAVIGARGGSGATTIAINVAAQLDDPCILDLDQPVGGLAFSLCLNRVIPEAAALLYTPSRIEPEMLDAMVMRKDGLSVFAAPASLTSKTTILDDPQGMETLISHLLRRYRNVVLDMPMRWTAGTEALLSEARAVILVTTPDLPGITAAQPIVAHLGEMGIDPMLVLNQAKGEKSGDLSEGDIRKAFAFEDQPIHVVSESAEIRNSVINGELFVTKQTQMYAAGRAARHPMRQIGVAIRGEAIEPAPRNTIWTSLFNRIRRGGK